MTKNLYKLVKSLKYILFIITSLLIIFVVQHYAKHHTNIGISNAYRLFTLVWIWLPIFLNGFFIFSFIPGIINSLSLKKFICIVLISLMVTFEIDTVNTLHYIPYILLSFLITLYITSYLFTIEGDNQKLDDIYEINNNSFTLLRFFFASAIFFIHYFNMFGFFYGVFNTNLGQICVWGFITISGYFIIQSINYSKDSLSFLIKRILRIFPLFIFVQIVFLFWTHNIGYFVHGLFLNFFNVPQGIFMQYVPQYWTLPVEFFMYIILLLCYYSFNKSKSLILGFTIILIVIDLSIILQNQDAIAYQSGHNVFDRINLANVFSYKKYNYSFLGLICAFFTSVTIYNYKDKVFMNKHTLFFAIILYYFISLTTIEISSVLNNIIILPYIIIAVGSMMKIQLWTKFGDYSYGLYLFQFIVIRLTDKYFHLTHNLLHFIILYVITLIFSILSWHLIENPMLKLKKLILH